MNILYISNTCTPNTYEEMFRQNRIKPSEAAQKYHRIMAEGFSLGRNNVTMYSILPINETSKKIIFRKSERFNGVKYHYCPFINLNKLRYLVNSIYIFFSVLMKSLFRKQTMIVCDSLALTASLAAVYAGKITRTKTVGIVTDLLEYLDDISDQQKQLYDRLYHQFDGYVFLTKHMNPKINKQRKPYVVIEGQVDYREKKRKLQPKSNNTKICMYAGAVVKQYGLEMFVKGFIKAGLHDWELHIFGEGDYLDELKTEYSDGTDIKCFGSIPNEKIVEMEKNADLLVNPRYTEGEYNKYSYPSKNLEYMVSGTPMLTTVLPGMPDEDKKYVYLLKDETIDGVAERMKQIASLSDYERQKKGRIAREYALRKKSNRMQAQRIAQLFLSK